MQATSYYHQAEKHALKANELASDAREKLSKYKELKTTIRHWDETMSQNPITAFTSIFVLVAIGEYLVSIELYTDLLPRAPWIIPLVIIGISIVISHWLAYKFISGLTLLEYDQKRKSSLLTHKTDQQIRTEISRKNTINFVLGLIAAIGISIFIYFFSMERVQREIDAGMRIKNFGFYDALPVLFYIAEIITGVYIIYILKRLKKVYSARTIKNGFDKLVKQIASETENAILSFETAEKNGFDLLQNTISESIHIAFYRNKNCNPSDEETYIAEPQNISTTANFQLDRSDSSKPLLSTVHIFTEYNYAATSASDEQGLVEFSFSSFPNDTIKKVVVEFSDGINAEDSVIYQTSQEKPHRVLFRV